MSKVQKISIALPKSMTDMLRKAVKGGQYASASEVVREALRDWNVREKARAEALGHLRALVQEGIDSGPGREIDFEELKAEMHAELARRKDGRRRVA